MTGKHAAPEQPDEYAQWHTVDFHPAAYGWALVSLSDRGTVKTEPLVGWLVQAEVAYDSATDEPVEVDSLHSPIHRIVAAVHIGAELEVAYDALADFWRVDPPNTPKPTAGEISRELERRTSIKAAMKGVPGI
jgi:hypothetical protein